MFVLYSAYWRFSVRLPHLFITISLLRCVRLAGACVCFLLNVQDKLKTSAARGSLRVGGMYSLCRCNMCLFLSFYLLLHFSFTPPDTHRHMSHTHCLSHTLKFTHPSLPEKSLKALQLTSAHCHW